MNNLKATVAQLQTLSEAYARRADLDLEEHATAAYNRRQSLRFYTAAEAIRDAIRENADRG